MSGDNSWTVVLGIVAGLTSAVSALFGLLYSRLSKDLAEARAELAAERKGRHDFVLQQLNETKAREAEQTSIVADLTDLTKALTRGAIRDEPSGGRASESDLPRTRGFGDGGGGFRR